MLGEVMGRPALAAAATIALSLSAGAAGTERAASMCPSSSAPRVHTTAAGRATMDLQVMLYNVEGLPFPARMNRAPDLARIGLELAALRASCNAPQLIVLQEVFSDDARRIGARAGYPYVASGPAADSPRRGPAASIPAAFDAARQPFAGETAPKFINSGLQLLSTYPITSTQAEPFSARACAGTDCLANKGAMLVRVQIPGMPAPLEILNTHMNSRKGAGVPYARTDQAHRFQTDELTAFMASARRPANPLIIAGDFNMKAASLRFRHYTARMPHTLVHRACEAPACDFKLPSTTPEPWMETQDLQAFAAGSAVSLRPIRVEQLFDGRNRPELSDHVATIVTYRLSWQAPVQGQAPV
jgi:endonuclease/exonuclease/phosphatase family metal-dependent hydrolase